MKPLTKSQNQERYFICCMNELLSSCVHGTIISQTVRSNGDVQLKIKATTPTKIEDQGKYQIKVKVSAGVIAYIKVYDQYCIATCIYLSAETRRPSTQLTYM